MQSNRRPLALRCSDRNRHGFVEDTPLTGVARSPQHSRLHVQALRAWRRTTRTSRRTRTSRLAAPSWTRQTTTMKMTAGSRMPRCRPHPLESPLGRCEGGGSNGGSAVKAAWPFGRLLAGPLECWQQRGCKHLIVCRQSSAAKVSALQLAPRGRVRLNMVASDSAHQRQTHNFALLPCSGP